MMGVIRSPENRAKSRSAGNEGYDGCSIRKRLVIIFAAASRPTSTRATCLARCLSAVASALHLGPNVASHAKLHLDYAALRCASESHGDKSLRPHGSTFGTCRNVSMRSDSEGRWHLAGACSPHVTAKGAPRARVAVPGPGLWGPAQRSMVFPCGQIVQRPSSACRPRSRRC